MSQIDYRLVGACGIFCGECDIYKAYSLDDIELKTKIAKRISKKVNKGIKPEWITCDGCFGRLDIHWSPRCEILRCAIDHEVKSCGLCPDYPCEGIEKFYSSGYEDAKKNIERIREIGLEEWWKEKQR